MSSKSDLKFKELGNQGTQYPTTIDASILETFPVVSKDMHYISFDQRGEFTSLCPITSQPDFADIRFIYVPDKLCVESKSLKLYLFSFRTNPGFGETITNRIADDLVKVLKPKLLLVIGDFKPRGGIGWKTEAVRVKPGYKITALDTAMINKFN